MNEEFSIAAAWSAYEATALPVVDPNNPMVRMTRKHLRRAFYAGFQNAMTMHVELGDQKLSRQENIVRVLTESLEFAALVAQDKA